MPANGHAISASSGRQLPLNRIETLIVFIYGITHDGLLLKILTLKSARFDADLAITNIFMTFHATKRHSAHFGGTFLSFHPARPLAERVFHYQHVFRIRK